MTLQVAKVSSCLYFHIHIKMAFIQLVSRQKEPALTAWDNLAAAVIDVNPTQIATYSAISG
jgi:hypothetical protein